MEDDVSHVNLFVCSFGLSIDDDGSVDDNNDGSHNHDDDEMHYNLVSFLHGQICRHGILG